MALVTAPGFAQVGHDPAHSPYRDIRGSQAFTAVVGYLSGSSGKVGVGPSDGKTIGAKWEIRLGGPTTAFVGFEVADLERAVIDPRRGPADRVVGTADQSVSLATVGINIYLTGPKTWHGIAPYLGFGMGLAFGGEVPEDSSDFAFNTRFQLEPHFGIKWLPNQRVTFRFELKDVLWQLRYPSAFFNDPEFAPGQPPVLDPNVDSDTQWVHHPTFSISIGYAWGF